MSDADELKLRWEILKQEKLDKRRRHDERRQVRIEKWKQYEARLVEMHGLVVQMNEEKLNSKKEIKDLEKSQKELKARVDELERLNEALTSKLAHTKEKFQSKLDQLTENQTKQTELENELALNKARVVEKFV